MEPTPQQGMERLARIVSFAVPGQCPFCVAIASPPLNSGEEIMILSGVFTGLRARVLPPPYPDWLPPGEILLEPLGSDRTQYRFNQRAEIAQRLPGLDRPHWFPPISLKDAADLHDAILRFCLRQDFDHATRVDPIQLYIFVERVWRARLPLEPEEVGTLLERHGLPEQLRAEGVDLFRHCRDVLVMAVGRRPIKNKRTDYVRRRSKRARGRPSQP